MNAKTLNIINTMMKVIQKEYVNLLKIIRKNFCFWNQVCFDIPCIPAFIHLLGNIHTAAKATRIMKEQHQST